MDLLNQAIQALIVYLRKLSEVIEKEGEGGGRQISLAITYAENVEDKLDRAKAAIE